ncbi:MAG: hypothetical protein CMH76_10235, partial [Nitrospinae bacterium]|nr:hypothetical protein [Nitrospinota bacterium]
MPAKKKAAKAISKKNTKKTTAKKTPAKKSTAKKKKAPVNVMGWKPGVPREKPNGWVYDGPLRVNAKPKKSDLIFFGVGGVPHSADPKSHPEAVRRLRELG